MSLVLAVAVVAAQVLDLVTWLAMPGVAEANPLVRDLHSTTAWLLKGALVVLVFSVQPALRPKYAPIGELVAIAAIAAGCVGAGSNLAVLTAVDAAEIPRPAPEPAPIAWDATGIEQGERSPAVPERTAASQDPRDAAPPQPAVTVARDRPVAPRAIDRRSSSMPAALRGVASWVRASLGPRYLAARLPRGTSLRICGSLACVRRTVTDWGPLQRVFPGRVVDLSRADFVAVCGSPAMGTCAVTVWVVR